VKKIMILVIMFLIVAPFFAFAQPITGENISDIVNSGITDNNNVISANPPTITQIISNFMKWILGILGMLSVIGFAISGILYLTSAGDEERIKKAKSAMVYSIIGVIVGLMGFVIIAAVQNMLSGSSTF